MAKILILSLTMILFVHTPELGGNENQDLKGYKSKMQAVEWSVLATIIPASIALFPKEPYRYVFVGIGLAFGPSAGHFYAHEWRRGLRSMGFRVGIASLGFLALLPQIAGYPGDVNGAALLGIIGIGGGFIVGSAIYDILKTPSSVQKYNEKIGKTNLQLLPDIDLKENHFGLAVVYRF